MIGATLSDLRALVISLQEEINALKSTRTDTAQISPSIDYEDIIQEIDDRQSRKKNLIIFGVQESADQSNAQKRAHDNEQVKKILQVLDRDVNADSIKPIRLGPIKAGIMRPMKITLGDEDDVRACIKSASNLKRSNVFSRTSISFDHTPRQILNYKKLKQEMEERSARGEDGLKIEYVRGVPRIVSEN
ncbi:unnamed protein product [Acanthoscelides obtectus]|uniref:Uncharacterized protein n=1 Tax=Acanthoscelides obtectus TaxID=200917 RepID=A0A9P0KDB0_ACAOB|nr:unnamed protein product [Acanthoscelides obtectus]CAK1671969.1 hypothetical protein AOBTE_LOCUS28577 [Acanthoscelides obtectus]